MARFMKVSTFVLFLLSLASLTLGSLLFQQREKLKARILTLENTTQTLAKKLDHAPLDAERLKQHDLMKKPLQGLVARAENTRTDLLDTRKDLTEEKGRHEETQTAFQRTKTELATARDDVTNMEEQLDLKIEALNRSKNELAQRDGQIQGLEQDLELFKNVVAEKEQSIDELDYKLAQLEAEFSCGLPSHPIASNQLESEVVLVNQEWNYVVLNKGKYDGLVPETEFHIHRGEKLIGKVKVTSAEADRSIADIVAIYDGQIFAQGDGALYFR